MSSSSSSSSSVASASAYCPSDEPCKILPLGDSITFGLADTFPQGGGYRRNLFRLAVEAGMDITFVGREENGPATVAGKSFPRSHEGYSGWTIGQIDGIVPNPALNPNPHIILLHIGTNNMYSFTGSVDVGSALNGLRALLDDLIAAQPDSLIAVSSIIPFPLGSQYVSQYNAEVPNVIAERAQQGAHIIYVDQFSGFPTSELADGVHPNENGYDRMGSVWFNAIYEHLVDID